MTEDVRKTALSTRLLLLAAAISVAGALWGAGRLGHAGASPPADPPIAPDATAACPAQGVLSAGDTKSFPHGQVKAALSSGKVLQGGDGVVFVSIALETAQQVGDKARAPVDMALVIDRSGSMSGDKIESARRAARGLVERLSARDRVALVQYDDVAEVVVPLSFVDAAGRARLLSAIDGIHDRGGTNLGAGLQLGRDQVRAGGEGRINRVILLSDGQANQGIVDPQALGEIARRAADAGVRISAIGMGLDYNEDLMELLAEHGRGRYHYVREARDLDRVFAAELGSLTATLAVNTAVRLEPTCAAADIVTVFGHEIRREGRAVIVPLPDLFAGDRRRLLAKLHVPTIGRGWQHVVRASLVYTDVATRKPMSAAVQLGVEVTRDLQAAEASIDRDIMAEVVEVESALVVKEAARAYERGDKVAAKAALDEQMANIDRVQKKYKLSAEKLTQSVAGVSGLRNDVAQYAPSSAEGKHALKFRKAAARAQMKH